MNLPDGIGCAKLDGEGKFDESQLEQTVSGSGDRKTMDYAGDVTPKQAMQILVEEIDSVLIDVRTEAEWQFVGCADLSRHGKESYFAEWQSFPTMERNESFVEVLSGKLAKEDKPADTALLFLCRSGQRSKGAAAAMTAAGYTRCYNITGGFEGDMDDEKHRGQLNGWKKDGLPWVQS